MLANYIASVLTLTAEAALAIYSKPNPVSDFFADVWVWLVSVATSWEFLVGILLAIAIPIGERLGRRSFHKRVPLIVIGITFVLASFIAWREQYTRGAIPKADITYMQVSNDDANDQVAVTAIVTLYNRGAQRAFNDWNAYIDEADGHELRANIVSYQIYFLQQSSFILKCSSGDSIYARTAPSPVPAAGITTGILWATFAGRRIQDLNLNSFYVSYQDVFQNIYKSAQTINASSLGGLVYTPGLCAPYSAPTASPSPSPIPTSLAPPAVQPRASMTNRLESSARR